MKTCKDCRLFTHDGQYTFKADYQWPEDVTPEVVEAAKVLTGICRRYPQQLWKNETEWCGEYRPRTEYDA